MSQLGDRATLANLTEEEATRYDRQMRLWGIEAQQRMRNASILVVKLSGLATEAIKNMVLAGIGRLVVMDGEDVSEEDLGAGFFFRDDDVGQKRLIVAKPRIESLNPLVSVEVFTDMTIKDERFDNIISSVDLVCATDLDRDSLIRINTVCRQYKKPFYAGGVYGFTGFIFCDLLDHEYLSDDRSKNPPKPVKFIAKYPPLDSAIQYKWSNLTKRQTKEVNPGLFFTILALWQFQSVHGVLPSNIDHLLELENTANQLIVAADVNKQVLTTAPHDVIESLSTACCEFSPICAIVGGMLAQDILKALGGREPPIANFFVFDGNTGGGTTLSLRQLSIMSLQDTERPESVFHGTQDFSPIQPRRPQLPRPEAENLRPPSFSFVPPSQSLSSLPVVPQLDTPATRTGPPRSLSLAYVRRGSSSYLNDPYASRSSHGRDITFHETQFRGPLEDIFPKPEKARKAKEDQRGLADIARFCDSTKQETTVSAHGETNPGYGVEGGSNTQSPRGHPNVQVPPKRAVTYSSHVPAKNPIRQSVSMPHRIDNEENSENKDKGTTMGGAKWARLRSFFRKERNLPGPSSVTPNIVNITDELITGGLSTLMLKLWFERDEKGHRRIPILLHRLRIRVSDSLHAMHGHKSVFRIECEYANGAARWVVYRQLWDFWSLHTHYAVSNVYNRNVDNMPDFPTSIASLHYYKFLKKERGDKVTKADFARLQRESLETYFIKLIRAVMFQPSANRLCTFLEISTIFLSLAHSSGAQLKAGFLRVEPSGSGGQHFGRKSAGWCEEREKRWCVVSDSYLVAMEEPGQPDVWDVFLLDSDFRIERPKRYYRQGFDLVFPHDEANDPVSPETQLSPVSNSHTRPVSAGTWMSKVFHNSSQRDREEKNDSKHNANNDADLSPLSSIANFGAVTPLLDPSTNTNPLQDDTDIWGLQSHPRVLGGQEDEKSQAAQAHEKNRTANFRDVSKHTFYIVNSQMRLKLVAKNTRQMLQFITALEKAAATSPYTGSHRFGSFSPVRLNVSAQWLVDGRDYFWNLSKAILLAKESIYIHDWWLSPEVLLRRPNKDKYRLDHLLERKAREGVKIYIILYLEVSNKTTPTDSNYAKQRLINLHENIMVQRSPSHFQTGTFYWAHHEKLCVVDKTIAFMGGLDLCFGRWDTPQHVLMDDVADTDRPEIWPGKDYSNPRMSDFYGLDKPEEDMYDRMKVPRMPWHDVGLQVIGQPARDLARHFVQRWNYLLRIKNHSKKMPFLLPPPEFLPGELDRLSLTGTCELQICRSGGPWSLGTSARVEHSIQTAYLKAIEQSEHFVYIENQFFITSTVVNDVKIENRIADTIVHRIIRAHREGSQWKCCVVIPLLPGFTYPVDHSDASAIRIILECQNRTICRGPDSIFARLRKEGINPDDFIAFFSLRNWGKMRGDVLTTEQVYIHSKICIVDDRLVIIGSANINERSQLGDRDSELAAVIRDTDMIQSTMAGQPFKVGRFAHTLRVHLMREHLGIDVDSLNEEDLMIRQPVEHYYEQGAWNPDNEQSYGLGSHIRSKQKTALGNFAAEGLGNVNQVVHAEAESTLSTIARRLQKTGQLRKFANLNVGDQPSGVGYKNELETHLPSSISEENVIKDQQSRGNVDAEPINQPSLLEKRRERDDADACLDHVAFDSQRPQDQPEYSATGPDLDKQRIGTHSFQSKPDEGEGDTESGSQTLPTKMPKIDSDDFYDPISDRFWNGIWNASANHNTEIFRKVFHAIPDDHVATWKQYKEYVVHHERLNKSGGDSGQIVPSETDDDSAHQRPKLKDVNVAPRTNGDGIPSSEQTFGSKFQNEEQRPHPLRRSKLHDVEPFEPWEREEMEKLLGEINGHLVIYPTRFLEAEDDADNFLFNADRLLPLPIYV